MYHLVARCCEGACQWKKSIKTQRKTENNVEFDILTFEVNRHKTQSMGKHAVYPHRDKMLWDAYFGLAIQLITDTEEHEHLFHDFAKKNLSTTKNKDSNSSALWSHYFSEIKKVTQKYPDDPDNTHYESAKMDKKQSAYSHGRKKGINIMADDCHLQFQSLAFRSGWQVKNMHSAFDYIFNSAKKDNFCAKVLGGWTKMQNGEYAGGVTPTTDDIITNKEQVDTFISNLFFFQPNVDCKVRKLLVASLLRWYDDFQFLLEMDPMMQYEDDKQTHIVVQKVETARLESKVTPDTLATWQKEVIHGFTTKNWTAIPLEKFLDKVGDTATVDTRSLGVLITDMTENYNELARMHHDSEARASSLKLDIKDLKRDMSTMADDMKIMKDIILSQSMKRPCTDNGEDESTQQGIPIL